MLGVFFSFLLLLLLSLYNTVVPSCGPCMGLSPSSPPQPPLQARHRQEKKEKELGLVTLLTKQGISAQSQGGALVSPPRVIKDPSLSSCFSSSSLVAPWHYRSDSFADWASGLRPLQRKKPEKSPNSIFSLNLVEKLQQLGLDKVLARGEALYMTSHQQELRQGKECLSGLGNQQDPVGPL